MKRIIPVALLALMVLSLSCRGWYQVVSSKWSMEGLQSGPRILKNCDTIFIGWMDITVFESDWKSLGYESEKAWVYFVNSLNNHFIPMQFPVWLHGKKIVKARNRDETPPADAQIYIRFDRSVFYKAEQTYSIVTIDQRFNNCEVLDVRMSFIDLKSGKELHELDVVIYHKDNNLYYYSFEGRICNRVDNLAAFLRKYM